ncbi:YicC family protein [Aestuariicoccus sp. KMU-90]|uniref:YicC family protein n=2 Tax=Thetidibacter halocola TaxID=2827239 RepID=A0A8J7WBW1_9RHOB|nr:YicC family protein [Thetidibacter halocola]
MTGFASKAGDGAGHAWLWELRGVNGKGLDLRLRLPDWIEGLEPLLRKALGARVVRGNIQVSLKLTAGDDAAPMRLDEAQLGAVLGAMARIEAEAMAQGLSLAPSTAAEIVTLRGILTTETAEADIAALRDALLADFDAALDAFCAMRAEEGAALMQVLTRQIDEIAAYTAEAAAIAESRADAQAARLRTQLARVMENAEGADAARVAQELALIAVKSDITEELDRLRAHVDAARSLLAEPGAVGRKLDFLCQEFNREANTLCSKSGDGRLTQVGLALKTVIDQMREQVQNVE